MFENFSYKQLFFHFFRAHLISDNKRDFNQKWDYESKLVQISSMNFEYTPL